jgi:Domain of unknown function (DUF1707)
MRILGAVDRAYYPPGDLRVSDAERDLALSELSVALRAGRITVDEFGQRSEQVLSARTGKELSVPLADLPVDGAPAARATGLERPQRAPALRIAVGAAVAATCLACVALANALSSGPTLQQREFVRDLLAQQGVSIPLPPAPGFDWPGTIVPGAIAVLLVMLIIFLRTTRAHRVAELLCGRASRRGHRLATRP